MNIFDICKCCDYITEDCTDFKGFYYSCYDDVIKFLDENKEVFTIDGVCFCESLFCSIMDEVKSYEISSK